MPDCTLGFLNEPFRKSAAEYNTPLTPFPWFAWNNRSYVSGAELLQVTKYSTLELPRVFGFMSTGQTENYSGSVTTVPSPTGDIKLDGPFSHLMNFFRTSNKNAAGTTLPLSQSGIVGLYRVLDYVHVPSRFVGTETWMNPTNFGLQVNTTDDARMNRQPPFNRISSYRDPGRMNLNTVVSADVWDGGLLHRQRTVTTASWDPFTNNYLDPNSTAGLAGFPPVIPGHAGPLFVDVPLPSATTNENGLVESRRGYQGSTVGTPALDDSMLLLEPTMPTFFANPFRSADAGNLVPLANMRQEGVDCTTLRGVQVPGAAAGVLQPLFASDSTNAYDNAARNPYFRYQPIMRQSNLTTTRSNVYAVWVTIGFFEVEEADDWATDENGVQARFNNDRDLYNKVYPDGYQLSSEAGVETGDIQRIREFALIDRTVPVAFEPGKDHNVDKAIRLRRRIE